MIKFVKKNNAFFIFVGLYCLSVIWEFPSSCKRKLRFFGQFRCNSTWSPGYHGKHAEFWMFRTYFLCDIDHYEDFESMQSYFNIPLNY